MSVGVVIIGRNEGERLKRCLASVARSRCRVVYVDSGSSDGSVEAAKSAGAEVVELDLSKLFTAARARNEGFRRVVLSTPEVTYIQFVDGDCTLQDGWIEAGVSFLKAQPAYAAVCGRIREVDRQGSVYNRLCDMEWNGLVGEIPACGGIALYRVASLSHVGGFDSSVVAGEEPELCLRLRNAGWKIHRLNVEMALHDAAMKHFSQWWNRAVRGGYGGTDVAIRFEKRCGQFSQQRRSARLWGLGWPVVVMLGTVAASLSGGWYAGALVCLFLLILLPVQMIRVGLRARRRCGEISTALAYGVFTMLGKWAFLQGEYRYRRDRKAGRGLSRIEYRQPELAAPAATKA